MLEDLRVLVTAQEWLNHYLGTPLLESSARASHEQWRAAKTEARLDPNNPYQGWGATRIKVRDLSTDEKSHLGIHPGATPSADVYHPLDRAFEELDTDTRSKNIVPMITLCNALGDFILPENGELAALEQALEQFLGGANPELTGFLRRLQHLAFAASEVRTGARPYGGTPREDLALYDALPSSVQDLDETTLRPVAQTLLVHLRNNKQLAWTIGFRHGQRILAGVTPEEAQTIVHYPDFNSLGKDSSMSPTSPSFWPTVEDVFKNLAAGVVEQVFYDGIDGDSGEHLVGVVVYDLSLSNAYVVGQALNELTIAHSLAVRLSVVRGAESEPSMPATCPICHTSWIHCRRREDHRYDAQQSARRR